MHKIVQENTACIQESGMIEFIWEFKNKYGVPPNTVGAVLGKDGK